MRAGDLNKRAHFQHIVETPDGAGGATRQWAPAMTVWAQFSPERARERIQQGRLASNFAGVLRIRWSRSAACLTAQHRVILDCTVYNIRSISNPDQRRDMIEMIVETDGTII